MPLKGIMDPGQLDILTAVITAHCDKHGITREKDRADVARRAIWFYENGQRSPNELLAVLERDADDPS